MVLSPSGWALGGPGRVTARMPRNCRSWILPGGIIGGFRSVDPISGHIAMKMEIGARALSITRKIVEDAVANGGPFKDAELDAAENAS